jgi:hypothetical protein
MESYGSSVSDVIPAFGQNSSDSADSGASTRATSVCTSVWRQEPVVGAKSITGLFHGRFSGLG